MSLNKVNEEMINDLYDLILSLKDNQDCRDLFSDMCTNKEVEQMAQRIRAARLLLEGKTYNAVSYTHLEEFSENIKHYHISDQSTASDCLLPFCGSFPFKTFFDKLIEKNYGGSCIIEVYRNSYKEYEEIYNSYNLTIAKLKECSYNSIDLKD